MEAPTLAPPSPRGRPRLRHWLARLTFSLVLFLILAELALRLAGWITLSRRARSVEADLSATPGVMRVLHIGESTTFGHGVAPEEAYPAVLARLLQERRPGQPVASFNRGVPGLTTTGMLRTLPDKLAIIHPDLVTIMAGANDYNERLNGLRPADDTWLPGPVYRWVSGLRLHKVARLALDLRRPGVKVKDGEILYYRHGASKNILYEKPRDEDKVARVTALLWSNLEKMIRLCREAGVPVVLVGYIQAIEENAVLESVAAELGIPYVSTFIDRDARPPDLFVEDGWHPSPVGHRHIAGQIVGVIETSVPLEARGS